jgi:ankyrin repeat protein
MKSGATALFVAAQNGYLEVVQDLVAANKSLVNMCLQNGTSPLYVAAQNGHLDVVKYLQQEGADTREKSCGGASPFFIAAQNGRLPILIFLRDVEHKSPRSEPAQM